MTVITILLVDEKTSIETQNKKMNFKPINLIKKGSCSLYKKSLKIN